METRYSTSQAAKKLGISARTLLRYEERGLISPEHLPSTGGGNGHRRYTEADIEYLRGKR